MRSPKSDGRAPKRAAKRRAGSKSADSKTPRGAQPRGSSSAKGSSSPRRAAARPTAPRTARQQRPEPPPSWKPEFRRFIREWRRKHPRPPGKRHEMARTFLGVTRTADTHVHLSGLGAKQVPVIVENLGSVAAYTCVVRMYEARPRSPIHEKIPLTEFTLGGQLVFTLQPGERTTVRVPFTRSRTNGTFIAIISDPLLDPNELTVADQNHRRLLLTNLV